MNNIYVNVIIFYKLCHILINISIDVFISIPNWSSGTPFNIFMEEEAHDSKCAEGTRGSHALTKI